MSAPRKRGTPKGTVRATPEDLHIAARIRARRLELKIPMANLTDLLGVSLAQYAKYETGANRLSAGRLFQIAVALETPIEWFFEGLTAQESKLGIELRKKWQRLSKEDVEG